MNNPIYLQLISLDKTYNNHFLKRYVKLVSFYKERNLKKVKNLHHEHHIVPDSFGGPDTVDNLVCITLREHFILHWILYKAFPKSQMTTAFFAMCSGFGKMDFKVTSKVYENMKIEYGKIHHFNGGEIQRQTQNRRVKEGTNPFNGGEIQRQTQRKLVVDGKHHWQDKEKQSQRAKKRVLDGKHPFSGGEIQRKNNLKRVAEGKHHWQDKEKQSQRVKKRVEDGEHNFLGKNQIKIECPHCKKIVDKGNYNQYHGDKCKLNPLYKEEIKEKVECPHCHRFFSKGKLTRYHGDKCKLKPSL